MDDENEKKEEELTAEQIEEYKRKYPQTFEALSEALPEHVIASGCDAYDECSKDELMAALLANIAGDAMVLAMLTKAIGANGQLSSEEMPSIFSGRKKNNKA